jgi:hypothetical protein
MSHLQKCFVERFWEGTTFAGCGKPRCRSRSWDLAAVSSRRRFWVAQRFWVAHRLWVAEGFWVAQRFSAAIIDFFSSSALAAEVSASAFAS